MNNSRLRKHSVPVVGFGGFGGGFGTTSAPSTGKKTCHFNNMI